MLANATRLCEAKFGTLYLRDGDAFRAVAFHNAPPAFVEERKRAPIHPGPHTGLGRALRTKQVVHIADAAAHLGYLERDPVTVAGVELGGYRTVLTVPMLKENEVIGAINVLRQEVRPFTDKQIDLVTSFARQAVIAIENVRLLNELRQSLQQQTATADVLKVISRSAFDLQVVLNTLVESAARLCEADTVAIGRPKGETYYFEASYGLSREYAEFAASHPAGIDRGTVSGRVLLERKIVHIPDVLADPEYTYWGAGQKIGGSRTLLGVPLLREGSPMAIIALAPTAATPSTCKQIELGTTFADQAVIAIDNVPLFDEVQARTRELSEALEHQTATSEVLNVISRSPTDAQPVFDAIVQGAARLCEAQNAGICLCDGDVYRFVARHGFSREFEEYAKQHPMSPGRGSAYARAVLERRVVHIPDVLADPEYTWHEGQEIAGIRAVLGVPLLRDGDPIGVISVARKVPEPFTSKQIELVTTFADQAVIAIENVRLFDEVQARTRDLAQSVAELRALGEVSRAVSSTLKLETVLETIVGCAVQLSRSDSGIVYEFDEVAQTFQARGSHRITPEHLAIIRAEPIRFGEGAVGRAGAIREPVQVADIADERQFVAPQTRALLVREGLRSLLAIPFVREQRVLGGLVILRRELGAFSPEIVATLQTFAAQSVLAIQNARLFREIEDKSRQLAEASEHKSQFVSSVSHELRTPLNAIIGLTDMLVTNAARFGTEKAK